MYKRYLYYRDTANTENIGLMDEDGGGSISQRQTEREKDKEMERVKKKERERETSCRRIAHFISAECFRAILNSKKDKSLERRER